MSASKTPSSEVTPRPRRRWFQFRLRTIFVVLLALCLGLGLWRNWDYLPGTLHFDEQGFPHGTGKKQHFYDAGPLMVEEWYRAGVLTRSTWYRPEGSIVASEKLDRENGGVGYYLRQDGSIKIRYSARFNPSDRLYLWHGRATYYARDGSIERVAEYRDGVEVKKEE